MKNYPVFFLISFSVLFSCIATGQEMPSGQVVRTIDCSLNAGVSMGEAVEWARNQPRDPAVSPGQIYFRQAIFAGNYRADYDFRQAMYYPSYTEMDARVVASNARPENRIRSGTRATDLFTCHQETHRVSIVRGVNPGNDGFSGQQTNMTTRFCQLNEGASMQDAYGFAQGVAANFSKGGINDLMQLYTRGLGPVGDTVAGRGFVIAAVPATRANWGARLDYARNNNVLDGLSPQLSCDYPVMWITNAVYRQQAN